MAQNEHTCIWPAMVLMHGFWVAGYNTLETTKEPILEHIRKQSAIYLTDEHEIQRSNPTGKLDDSRVDVALFFIAPHRLRPLDIEFITDLAELVPVVGGGILTSHLITKCAGPGTVREITEADGDRLLT